MGISFDTISWICYNAPMPDASRPVATSPDTTYSLSVEDAAQLYARAGHPRTLRTVQRYCASGHLDCVKAATMLGDKYFVEPSSVGRHIAQIEELVSLTTRAQGHGFSRQVATDVARQPSGGEARHRPPENEMMSSPAGPSAPISRDKSEPDGPRQTATVADPSSRRDATEVQDASRHVATLEREVERLSEDRTFLRQQIATKDEQIASLLERDRETNILVRGLQQMLSPLLGRPRPDADDAPNNQRPF